MTNRGRVKQVALMLAAALIFGYPGAAAGAEKEQAPQPISVYADYVHYDQISGDVFAEGNARVVQGGQTILAERIDGNARTGDIRTSTVTEFRDPATGTRIFGERAEYNYNTKTGKISKVTGRSGGQQLSAREVNILPERMAAHDTMISRCDSQGVKCQHITAKRVDIWPDDKIIAYDADIYILGHKLAHRDRYISRVGDEKQTPRIGYDSDYGLYIGQTLEFPVDHKLSFGVDLLAGTDIGGRSMGWASWRERNFNAKYSYGYAEDDDDHWIKKEHNIRINYPYKKLFGLPLNYSLWYERGLWKEGRIRSWHMDVGVYLSADAIYFGKNKSLWLNLGTGYRHLKESYGDFKYDEYRYDIGLSKRISGKWLLGSVYSHVSDTFELFDYNDIDVAKSLTYFIAWQPDRMNKVTYSQQWDTERHRLYRNRISYTRNLHCWEIVLSYERERPIGARHENRVHLEINMAI